MQKKIGFLNLWQLVELGHDNLLFVELGHDNLLFEQISTSLHFLVSLSFVVLHEMMNNGILLNLAVLQFSLLFICLLFWAVVYLIACL